MLVPPYSQRCATMTLAGMLTSSSESSLSESHTGLSHPLLLSLYTPSAAPPSLAAGGGRATVVRGLQLTPCRA
jgi:hypothetical protein